MKRALLSQILLWKKAGHKGSIPINKTLMFALGAMVTALVLALLLPALMNLKGLGPCTGPFKSLASVIADMTGSDMC